MNKERKSLFFPKKHFSVIALILALVLFFSILSPNRALAVCHTPTWPIFPENDYNQQNYTPRWDVHYNHYEMASISSSLPLDEVIKSGRMHIPDSDPTITDMGDWRLLSQYWTTYQLTVPPLVDGDSARFEARVKAPLEEGAIQARDPMLEFSGENGKSAFVYWMADDWGGDWAKYAAGDTMVGCVSELVQGFDEWHVIALETKNSKVSVFYDGHEVKSMDYENNIGMLHSLRLGFKGRGSIDWVKLYEGEDLAMTEDFNIDGETNVEFFKEIYTTPDPVVIIPGIMGSWEKNGVWQIDPIFHTYDDLIEAFIAAGYENDGKELSVFPYQWRDSNVKNAKILQARIEDIREETGRPKVDIVAHSMGGLLAREYIESDYYENDVDQLITLGTPHLGAPKDYVTWEAGEFLGLWAPVQKKMFEFEAAKSGYRNIFDYVHGRPIDSVEELLPTYSYLFDESGEGFVLRDSYPENYPRNEFLEELNSEEKVKRLEKIEFSKIVGDAVSDTSTVSGYNVVDSNSDDLWQHGYPKYFDIPVMSREGIIKGRGDGTVSLNSAESTNVSSDELLFFQSEHGELVTDAQKNILEILTGDKPANEVREWHVPNLLLLFVYSPVDIQVESPDGKKIGKNFVTGGEYDEIDGAFYTGFDTETEFITIPNPLNGEYKILTQGTGEGNYAIDTLKVSEDAGELSGYQESSAMIEGEVQPGEIQEVTVQVNENEIVYNPDTEPPVITISSPEEKSYNNDEILEINFDVLDERSGVESTGWHVDKDGEKLNWQEKNVDLSLEHLGNYVLWVSATDEKGNSSERSVEFEISTNIDAIRNNVDHYWDLDRINTRYEKRYLEFKLDQIGELFAWLEMYGNSNIGFFAKRMITNSIKTIINFQINSLIYHINQVTPRLIDEKASEFLIESLNGIKF